MTTTGDSDTHDRGSGEAAKLTPAYITGLGKFLPGEPIPTDRIEEYIGSLGPESSQVAAVINEKSGIKTRHYAIDTQQATTHSSASMAAEAVRDAIARSPIELRDIDLLAAGCLMGDLAAPGLAGMVHGELKNPPCEIVTTSGFCVAGVTALKNAYLQVRSGEKRNAVACASEAPSRLLKSSRFAELDQMREEGKVDFEMDFLRYMLADGAGAALIQDVPAAADLSLRIDWISVSSFADSHDPCMYVGSNSSNGSRSWLDYPTFGEAAADGAMMLRQDLAILPRILDFSFEEYVRLIDAGKFDPQSIDFFVCEYASEELKQEALRQFEVRGCPGIPEERWFANTDKVGNVGSAFIYLALEDLMTSGKVEAGDEILCFVPESGRFTVSYALLTAVGPTA